MTEPERNQADENTDTEATPQQTEALIEDLEFDEGATEVKGGATGCQGDAPISRHG